MRAHPAGTYTAYMRPDAVPPFAADDRAACKGTDPDLWFPNKGESAARAKAVCLRCILRPACRAWALQPNQQAWLHGVWGGTSATDRRRITGIRGQAGP